VGLSFRDNAADPAGWAELVGASARGARLLAEADFIDLHLDLDVPIRVYGYDPHVHHGRATRVRPFFRQTDLPRVREATLTGIVYDIPTNPWRPPANRYATTVQNLDRVTAMFARLDEHFVLVDGLSSYREARAAGRTAVWLSLQGANAVEYAPASLNGQLGARLHRITLVHLTTSTMGGTSSPTGVDPGLSALGADVVRRCNDARILVDLAHAGERTFFDALDVHADACPPIVSHTGVDAVRPHWRNLSDDQIRAIADRGGIIGIMYQSNFLVDTRTTAPRSAILDHLQHVCELVGDAFAAIGTDYDGVIVPPHDLLDITDHPVLVDDMLARGWTEARIRGILGGNYLRVVEAMGR
jgi:membrane dipeptidase